MQCFIQAFAPGGWAPRAKRWAPRGNLTKKFFGGAARDPILLIARRLERRRIKLCLRLRERAGTLVAKKSWPREGVILGQDKNIGPILNQY
jgi:hypothetical protein